MTRSASDPPRSRIEAAARGDREAAGELLEALLPRVRNLVRYLVRGDNDVDDIAQQALVAVLRGLPGYRGEGSLSSWADRITARETFAYLRRARAAQHEPIDERPELRAVADPAVQPDEYALRREAVRLLDDVPEDQRRAIVLHHVVGMSVPELAQHTDVSFDTAKSRLRLGMKKLRAHALQGDGDD